MLEISLDSKKHTFDPSGKTGLDAAKELYPARRIAALKVNGELRDLHLPLPTDGPVEFVLLESEEANMVIRHSTAHILAQAVKALYPEVQVTIGPVIDNGFFYDFSKKEPFKEEDLKAIETKMSEIIQSKLPIRREVWPVAKAVDFFKNLSEHYKVEIIQDLAKGGETQVSMYWQGDFVDLCRGPHIANTSHVPAFKLTHVAGAYWRGDEKNEMLTRIYGTAFYSREAQKAYLTQLEEAKKRDHRRIGIDQKLFSFHAEAPASPFFHPNGAFVYAQIQEFLRRLNRANGFLDVVTPLVMSQDLWKTSGHYDNYRENMYFTMVDERPFAVKPMNCPGHCLIYGSEHHSYRDLPMRVAEFGRVHRHERSGVTAGLFRVRSFVQDDAHIFCTEDQIEDEILLVLGMIKKIYTTFGFEYALELSTRPEKRIGSDETWDKAEKALANALAKAGEKYKLNPGDGAFYGPKIDFHLKDSIGRTHQCGTVQLDFMMPERFKLNYIGGDNTAHIPVMIHRAIIGSFERFLGIYIEHTAGVFPVWLAPLQIAILTVSSEAKTFAHEFHKELSGRGFRVKIDDSEDKLAAKIKRFQGDRPSYMVILGAREAQDKVLSLRSLTGTQRQNVAVGDFYEELAQEMKKFEI